MKYVVRTAIAAAASLLLFMFRNANAAQEKKHRVELETATGFRPFRLLFIADIHRKELPAEIVSSRPDAIIIGGDLSERGVPLQRTAHNLRILTEAAPVYFVWGNNDREIGVRNLRKLMDHFGVRILDNEAVEFLGLPHLKLAGVDFYSDKKEKIEKALESIGEKDTVIFAAHSPFLFRHVRNNGNIALSLAGHTHGGQIRLGVFGLYRKGSLRKMASRYELVSNGYGTTMLPLRLGAEAQYHVIDVYPKRRKQ